MGGFLFLMFWQGAGGEDPGVPVFPATGILLPAGMQGILKKGGTNA